jgi:hypothetical protein
VINQGLFYLDWLMDHRKDFQWLVLGSRLIDFQSQNRTVAARAMAERKTLGHRS